MSLFVAVFPPESVRVDLGRRLAGLRVTAAAAAGGRRARRTAAGKWHVTLAFLGEVPDDRVADVEHAVGRAVQAPRSPVVRLAGGGSFGRDLAAYTGPEWRVDGIVLVRSRAGTYEPVRTWRW